MTGTKTILIHSTSFIWLKKSVAKEYATELSLAPACGEYGVISLILSLSLSFLSHSLSKGKGLSSYNTERLSTDLSEH